MMNQYAIIRNHTVFCINSMFRIWCNKNNLDWTKVEIEYLPDADCLLRELCKETSTFFELFKLYKEACDGIDNDEFVKAFQIDKNHYVRIDVSDRIMLYYFQDRLRIHRKRIIPWDYPHLITHVGQANGFQIDEIAHDWSSMPMIEYYGKYVVSNAKFKNNCYSNHSIQISDNMYCIDDFMHVRIDDHISISIQSGSKSDDYYIADPWWSDDDEILNDIITLSPLQFGMKYAAVWGK